jgi:GntR family transcriptional regulator/MocR family aminotransferase
LPTTSKRRREVLDVPLQLDRASGNQARQVHASLRAAILDGRIAAGLRLPSSRALADQLRLGRNAVVEAYDHLLSDGLVETRLGAGTFVAARLPTAVPAAATEPLAISVPRREAFALGQTHLDRSFLQRLATRVRRRIAEATAVDLAYGDPRGSEALRRQIASHLAASRGVLCDPGHILIVSGVQQGLRLCVEALLEPGATVWMEDPGYPVTRRTLQAAGARLHPVPVDGEGIIVAAGRKAAGEAKAAYVTPSNQFPTGVTMSMARRVELLDWARTSGAWIFEDDYDNEFRYAGPSLTALAGLGHERIIYLGTFSKALFPGLRLAYIALPQGAAEKVVRARAAYDRFPPSLIEGAIADLMGDGTVAAHIRRARARYRSARDRLATALEAASKGSLQIVVPEQGLHILAYLPTGLPPGSAGKIRAMAGIEAWLLEETRLAPDGADGFILGFAGHGTAQLEAAAARLGRATLEYLGSSVAE